MSFNIPYPDSYNEWLEQIKVIELNMPALLPLDCLLGGISFLHTLIIQTLGPLVIIGALEFGATVLGKKAAITIAAAEKKGKTIPPPTSAMLAELCSNVSFFLLFLLYPGSSSKIFNALLCNGFTGEGEDGQRFLRVDFSIDCDSALYQGLMFPYALIMLAIYPIGVPVYYALTLFRNNEQLGECRNIELSAFTEGKRIELGNRLGGRARRDYQPEIDEAEARKAELEKQYEVKRDALPGKLKKLTNGYEMRTYWFEIFECTRKIMLVALPIIMPADSPEQIVLGLIICFVTFGAYMMYAPFIDDGDDLLSQICQMQIFFSLLSSIILKTNPNSPAMAFILPLLIGFPPLMGFVFESGILDELKKISAPDDNGWPIPCSGGKRIGVGFRARNVKRLERLLGVRHIEKEREELEDNAVMTLQNYWRDKRKSQALANQIREAQLLKLLERKPKADQEEHARSKIPLHIKAIFDELDANKNGTFDYKELRLALRGLGFDTTHPAAASYIKRCMLPPTKTLACFRCCF